MHLQKTLVAHGLYPREAKAMVDSWRGSWFEQGTRLFYIVSGDAVDAILPLQIDPQPVEVKRVFVGRIEIVTPETLHEVKVALEKTIVRRLRSSAAFSIRSAEQLCVGAFRASGELGRRCNVVTQGGWRVRARAGGSKSIRPSATTCCEVFLPR